MGKLTDRIITSILSLMLNESLFDSDEKETTKYFSDRSTSIDAEDHRKDNEYTICEHCDTVWDGTKHIYFCRWCKGK